MPCTPLRPLLFALLAGCWFLAPPTAFGAEKRKPVSTEEVAKLKRENDVLRAENQRLRKMLAESVAKSSTEDDASKTAKASKGGDPRGRNSGGSEGETGFWLSDGKKRHNAKCQYYRTSKGKPCGPNEGEACKVCGG